MKKFKVLDKSITSLGIVAYIIWLGGSFCRLILGFEIFQPGTLLLRGYAGDLNKFLVQKYAVLAPYTDISFIIMFIAALYLLAKYSGHIRSKGWLFMIIALIIISAIPSFYLIYMDYNLVSAAATEGIKFESPEFQKYFLTRFTKLNFLDPLILLSGFTMAVFYVFKPLNKDLIEANDKI